MSRVSLAYTGIVAETYDVLVTNDASGDAEYFRAVIRNGGEPALEIGCGTGRLLLEYVAGGLDVEGVDESQDMLRICRRKADQRGLRVRVHFQAMQTLDLAGRFRTLFVPAGSFMLLTDRGDAEHALARFHRHLVPGGRVLIPLEQPSDTPLPAGSSREGVWTRRRQGSRPEDGAAIECWERVLVDDSLRGQARRPDYPAPRSDPDDSLVYATRVLPTAYARWVQGNRRVARVHATASRATRRGVRLRRPSSGMMLPPVGILASGPGGLLASARKRRLPALADPAPNRTPVHPVR